MKRSWKGLTLYVGAMVIWLVAAFLTYSGFHEAALGALILGLVPLGALVFMLGRD